MTAYPSDLAPEIAALHEWFTAQIAANQKRKMAMAERLTSSRLPEDAVELAAYEILGRSMLEAEKALHGATVAEFAVASLLNASMVMGTLNPTTGSPTSQAVKAEAVPLVQRFYQSLAFQLGSALSLSVRDVPATLPEEAQP